MAEIGKRIKQRREELKITQEELASKLGYKNKSTITKIENGVNDIVQSKVCEFAKALNTTPAYLMSWTEEPKITTHDKAASLSVKIRNDVEAIELLETYYSLNDDKKAIALKLIKSLTE